MKAKKQERKKYQTVDFCVCEVKDVCYVKSNIIQKTVNVLSPHDKVEGTMKFTALGIHKL